MMNRLTRLIIISTLALSTQWAMAAQYVIDKRGMHASINFKIKHLGYSWLTGRFNSFDGQFSYDPAKVNESKVSVTIDTTSVDSNHAMRDKHLRSDDFLDVKKYPSATFVSSKVVAKSSGNFQIIGTLTLHGVSKEITIDAQHIGGGKDPWGGYRQGFSGVTTIALKDFGIKKSLGPASEQVELELHIEGIRQ